MPVGTPVLVPILNVIAEAHGRPVACEAYVKPLGQFKASIRDARFVVNGESIDLSAAAAETGCFELVDQRSGRTGKAAGAGLWVMLKPLKPGIYRVQFSGRAELDGFSQNVAYHLQVE